MIAPRCHAHKDRMELPPLCHVCQRIAVEQEIVTRTVDALLSAGFRLATDADDCAQHTYTADRSVILAALMEVDDEHLLARAGTRADARTGWVRFVYGNDGYDVISDYTTNLEDVLAPVNAYADTLA